MIYRKDLLAFALTISMAFNTASPKVKQEPAIIPEKVQVQTLQLKKGKRMLK